MSEALYKILVQSETEEESTRHASGLTDILREVEGVNEPSRQKQRLESMDIGSVVTVIATSAAASAIASGLADCLRHRRNTHLVVERNLSSGSLRTEVDSVDPKTALRIIETLKTV